MKLIDNAGKVLRQAWSVRLGIMAGLFSGAEVIVPLFADANGAQRARMGGLIFASNYYAAVAALGAYVSIVQIKIGTVTATLDQVLVGIDNTPTISDSDINVTLV